jgi:hypothetical protein
VVVARSRLHSVLLGTAYAPTVHPRHDGPHVGRREGFEGLKAFD